MYKNSILECIGNTPLVRLNKIEKKYNLNFKLFAKVERFNPTGSIKDRPAFNMIFEALKNNIINKDTLIIEPTSGNTGIGLAMVCSYYDLKCHIYMPESSSIERVKMMKAYGCEVFLTKKEYGMKGSVEAALAEHKKVKNSFIPSQFDNCLNPLSHYEHTANEIYDDLEGKIDYLFAGIGTGGTISGIGKKLKKFNKDIKIVGVEPLSSPLLTKNKAGSHKIQGIGPNFVPRNLDLNYIDKICDVSDENAYQKAKELAQVEGIFCGISSGACLSASLDYNKEELKDKNVVIILPDNGERYLSVENLYE